ncbi:hypothetical protein BGZ68_004340 [Mortierella alpina]|nr:hypothetical protein BGZ68_004340 [Mortierella alpina]
MKLYIGITAALALAFASSTSAAAAPEEYLKIPIRTVNGPIRLSTMGRWRHTLRKYGLSHTTSAAVSGIEIEAVGGPRGYQRGRALSESNVARIPLVDYDFDREYYGIVMIGQPPQSFKIDFDTGSSQFIIAAKGCAQCSGTTHYDPTLSKTFRANGKPWRITYGDQSHAAGYLGWDHITIDGIRVKGQQLALVTNESEGFDDTIDGIMGLAFGALSASIASTKTVFENMMAQKLVDQGIFSFYLGKSSLQGGGEFIFGGMDLDRVAPGKEITYTPVTRARYWQINIGDVLVNGRSVVNSGNGGGGSKRRKGAHKENGLTGIMDTGTTLMVVPEKLGRTIHQRIKGAKLEDPSYTVPCDLAQHSPGARVELEIEGKRFAIPFEDLVREETELAGTCYSGIQTSSAEFLIIGDVFIKNNYVVFDQANKRVGIAPLKLEVASAQDAEKLDIGINGLLEANEFSLDQGLDEHIQEDDEQNDDYEGPEGRDEVSKDDGEGHIEAQTKRWEITDEETRDHVGSVAKYSQTRQKHSTHKAKH